MLQYSAPGVSIGQALLSVDASAASTPIVHIAKLHEELAQGIPQNWAGMLSGRDGEIYFYGRAIPSGQTGWIWQLDRTTSAEDGVAHAFHVDGRISETRDRVTQHVLKTFEYDPAHRLIGIVDRVGKRVTLVRDANGRISQIVSPYGQTTALGYDTLGRLTTITDPDSIASSVTYTGDTQLMRSFTNRNGRTSWFQYDSYGRLAGDRSGTAYVALRRADENTVVKSDADGRVTQYVSYLAGGLRTRYVRFPDGTTNSAVMRDDGTETTTLADGTIISKGIQRDPRAVGQTIPALQTVKLPSGLTSNVAMSASVAANGSITTTRTVNGNGWVDTYVPATRTHTLRSPENRVKTSLLDTLGRLSRITAPGRAAVQFVYDADGRLHQLTAGTAAIRTTTLTYDALGRLQQASSSDASDTSFTRDLLGRALTQTTAGSVTGMAWDPLGNLTQVTSAGGNAHDLTYSTLNDINSYTPPVLAGGTRPGQQLWIDTTMGEPLSLTLANGEATALTRDPGNGRVSLAVIGGTTYTYGYHAQTGKRTGMTGSDGTSLTTSYDGRLVTGHTWGGASSPVAGSVGIGYNVDFNPSSFFSNGQQVAAFTYDKDQLLTGAGALVIARNPQSGDITGTTLGQVTTSATYDEHGGIATFRALYAGTALYEYSVAQRDGQGRILEMSETSAGATQTRSYRYDAFGQLGEVLINDVSNAVYTYTANGNRESRQSSSGTLTGVYDAQDRIDTYGACDYTMDAAGFLSQRDCGAGPDTFTYDARGSLRHATLANGDTIQYVIDPTGRRIGRRVNGAFDKGWLYLDGLRPAAQLNSAGQLEAIYVYGTRANVPDYIVEKTGGADVLYRVIADHLGTPRRVVRASDGVIVHELDVDEWGNVTREVGTALDLHPFGFAGGMRDRETGLVRFGARDYDPYAGRWTARDPILFDGGDSNLYAYAGNDPVNFFDPEGNDALQVIGDFSAGLGDALLLGFGDELRDLLDIEGVDPCSDAYSAGSWASFAAGVGRLGYAAAAKGISIAASSGAAASAAREQLKNTFRLGFGKGWRQFNAAGKSDAALRAGAGKTNLGVNAYGAGVAGAGAAGGSRVCLQCP